MRISFEFYLGFLVRSVGFANVSHTFSSVDCVDCEAEIVDVGQDWRGEVGRIGSENWEEKMRC